MNAQFAAQIAADTTLFKEQFGRDVTHIPSDGSPSAPLVAIFDILGQRNNSHDPAIDREFDAALAERIEVRIAKADANIEVQDALDDGGSANWVVDQIEEEGPWYRCWVTRSQGFIRG